VAASPLGTAADALSKGRFSAWLQGPDREVRADLAGVSTTRYPPGLIAALERIAAGERVARPGQMPAQGPELIVPTCVRAPPRDELACSAVGWLGSPVRRARSELDVRLAVLREL